MTTLHVLDTDASSSEAIARDAFTTSQQTPEQPASTPPADRRTPANGTARLHAVRPSAQPLLPVVGGTRDSLQVPLVDGRTVSYANLDYAASAPCLDSVDTHLQQVLPYYASVHRGAGYASQVSTGLYENARAEVARFVGARADDVVVFTRNTTDALNLLATAVPPKPSTPSTPDASDAPPTPSGVLHLDIEHHANLLPWARTADGEDGRHWLPAGTTQRGTLVALRAELTARPAALVAVTGASNVTGEVPPIKQITEIAHAAGARVVVDAAQLAPHRRIDLADSGIDYVAFSGHKLYAPFGSGALVGRRDWLDAAPAYLAGGGAVRSVEADHTEWADAPTRHEGGTPNVLGAIALARACAALRGLDDDALREHEDALRERLARAFEAHDGVTVHRIWRDSSDAVGVVAFSVAGYEPGLVAAYLSAEHGIGVRDGKFCAHPLLARLGAAGTLRASFGVGTTSDDIDRLITAVDALLEHGPRWTYAVVDGRWAPRPDPRTWPEFGRDMILTDTEPARPGAGLSPCGQ